MSELKKLKSDPLVVYAKDGVVRCLTIRQSIDMKPLIADQWQQTAIIDPAEWIEGLVNNGISQETIMKLKGGPQ